MLEHHAIEGQSDVGVYAYANDEYPRWKYVGPSEQYGHLLSQNGYYPVGKTHGGYRSLARQLAAAPTARTRALLNAADSAMPMIAATLALAVKRGTLDWDTDESLTTAARRLARDAAFKIIHYQNPPTERISGEDIYRLALPGYDPAEVASMYMQERMQIGEAINAASIDWGSTVDAKSAATIAGMTHAAWRATVSRLGQTPDAGRRWSIATVFALRIAQSPRARNPRGW